MILPGLEEEKILWNSGCHTVAGIDEAGRGPLAGPVVAAAVALKKESIKGLLKLGIKDSKQILPAKREQIYEKIILHPGVDWAVGIVSEKLIDKINILQATKLAMEKAIGNLAKKPDFLILDGNFSINSEIPQKSIIKGDAKVFSIAASSIIAKVTRDRLMRQYHLKYPGYGFDKNKGYGTNFHIKKLNILGPCKIHRKTFWPVSGYCNF